jgi:nucleoside 2-deoxyribosyltransferase
MLFRRIRRLLRLNTRRRYYLAGPISWVGDNSYITWRENMETFLKSIGHVGINPLKKYPVPAKEKAKVEQMVLTEKNQIAREYLRRRIIDADLALLENSDGVIAFIPGYSPGTWAEIGIAYMWKKPVYIVTSLPRKQWAGWFVGLSTLIFRSWNELKRFMQNMEVGV